MVDLAFLHDAAARGSEPARFAFQEAFVAYSRLPEVERLVAAIPVYPEQERDRKLAVFYAHAALYANYLVPEAERWENRYLLWQAATNTVLFAGRLLLAHNRLLFPSHKWLYRAIEQAAEVPADFLALAHPLLEDPASARARAVWECVSGFRDWGLSYDLAVGRFIESAEWGWREGLPGPGPAEW